MRILIATPLYPPDIGGPAKYAKALHEEYAKSGHGGVVVAYGRLERMLPPAVRHFVYFVRVLGRAASADVILALDTLSVGVPALAAALVLHKKFIVRIGGDFLWEAHVERTGDLIKYSKFYRSHRQLSFKERVVKKGQSFISRRAHALVFTTRYQQSIWCEAYRVPVDRTFIVENFYSGTPAVMQPYAGKKVFVSAGRDLKLKNTPRLLEAFAAVAQDHPDIELDTKSLPPEQNAARLKNCYAVIASTISDMNPNLILEGVAAGKPFVAPVESGASERLSGLGVFVDTSRIEELERGIRELLDPARYTAFAGAIQSFRHRHEWSEIAQEYVAIANEV